MSKILEELWFDYLMENQANQSKEERELIHALVKTGDELHASLTQEQLTILERRDDCQNEICVLFAKEAFIKGIRFATGYFMEAIK